MRVTDQMMLQNSLGQIQQVQERLLDSQTKASSGLAVAKPSDDPAAYGTINSLAQQISQIDTYNQNINLVQGRLSATDTTLQSTQGILTRLRELAVEALGTDQNSPSVTTEAQQLYSQLLASANQTFNGQYLFSPYSTTAPFSGSLFVGNNDKQAVQISPLGATQFGISAQDAFGVTPGQNVYSGIASLLTAMTAGNEAGIQAGLGAIDGYMSQAAQAQTLLGAQMNTLSTAQQANKSYQLTLQQSQGQLQDIDPAAAYSQLTADQYAEQATFSVIGSSSKISLLQYL